MNENVLDAVEQVIDVTGPYYSVADLSAGDGEILDLFDLPENSKFSRTLDDGPVEDLLSELPYVHLFVLNGMIRTLVDPLATLFSVREKSARVLIVDWEDDKWTVEAIMNTLSQAGLQPEADQIVEIPDGKFHVWLCRNEYFYQPDPANQP